MYVVALDDEGKRGTKMSTELLNVFEILKLLVQVQYNAFSIRLPWKHHPRLSKNDFPRTPNEIFISCPKIPIDIRSRPSKVSQGIKLTCSE